MKVLLVTHGAVVGEQAETPIAKDSLVLVAPDEHHYFRNNSNEILRFICVIPLVS